ncbi:STAS domain-containing protein [Neisseriaceae bacterium TC5R-5]|nr:STAS domain-containing protein [Neisseriaceae bacterium TC5R-5]
MARSKKQSGSTASTTPATSSLTITLNGEQTIYQASHLHQQLQMALLQNQHLIVDLSYVIEVDCAITQVLIWIYREALRQGKQVSFSHPSQTLSGFIELMGLQRALPCAEVVYEP